MNQTQSGLVVLCAVIAAGTLPGVSSSARAQSAASSASDHVRAFVTNINTQLEASGASFRVGLAEYLMSDDSDEAGQVVFFSDRGNKQIGAQYVPGDPRRGGFTNISFTIDETEGAVDALTVGQTAAAIDRAMATWEGVNCSTIPIDKVPTPGGDLGVIEFLNGLGGSPFVFADITHAGWLPGGILPNNVIAITFTFVFITGPGGDLTDIDNDGKADTAFTEILYNDFFTWRVNANIDVETIALHEAGHGLSQAHFGKAFLTNSNGQLHFAPRAVMNAAYSGLQQTIDQTDNAGHCSIWAAWPNN